MIITIQHIVEETADAKTFQFTADEAFSYRAGQFITVLFGPKGEKRRSYSFSSAPAADALPSITIKRTPNGEFSRWWLDELKPGMQLQALQPAGVFRPEHVNDNRDMFFCAAGSGITPVYSLIKQVLHDEPTARLHLFYSNSTPASAIFLQQLQALEEVYRDRFDIEWFFSDHADLTKARLGTYTLRSLMNRKMVFAKRDALVFTCGPYDYMKMVEITWLSEGFERNHFRKEIYDPENILPAYKLYYDHTDRVITIETGGRQHRVQVHWNQTILDAVLKAGLPLRYNCKAGRCSSCVCTVKSGKVWMHYNEVLTPSDEERNLALTCTGHPASGDVWILV